MNEVPDRLNREIYSIGIQGLSLEALIRALLREDIELVFDIRRRPSRDSPRLPAKQLADACSEANIYYVHRPELGTSTEFLRGGDPQGRLDIAKYREYLRHGHGETLRWAGDAARRHHTCVVGCNADPKHSHRQYFLEEVARAGRLRVVHLSPQLEPAIGP